ncbi:MAG: aldo/keto reductase [Pseudomonadota bacterium]
MDPFNRRRVGNTQLPALGFGGSQIGNLHRAVPEGKALAAIEAAYEAGIRYFDTAPLHGGGLGEHRIGHVLRRYPRDGFVLSTKVGRLCEPLERRDGDGQTVERLPFRLVYDYTHDGVLRSIEHSLQRLGLARIDIALIHDVDPDNHGEVEQERQFRIAIGGAYRALDRLRREGTIAAVGVGVNDWRVCRDFAESCDLDCFLLAGRYTLLEQGALDSLLPLCARRGIGVIVGAPFNSGILARGAAAGAPYNYLAAPPAVVDRVRRIEGVCVRHRVSLAAAALQFPFGHPAVASVLPGMRSPAQVERCLKWLGENVPAELWRELKHEGLIDPASPTPAA